MDITYGQLEATLAAYLRIHPDRLGTFRSRIKQLQRLQFPPGVNIGRGGKMAYSLAHLFQMVTAFELLGFAIPAQTACTLAVEHWDTIAGGFALAALNERSFKDPKPENIFAVMAVRNMNEMQISRYIDQRSSVRVCDESGLRSEIDVNSFNLDYCKLVISLSAILNKVLSIASESAGIKKANVFSESFHDWLPKDDHLSYRFLKEYPDRSNLLMRQKLHRYHGNDPTSFTPEGEEEAKLFLLNDYSEGPPF